MTGYMPEPEWQAAGFFYSAGLGFCLGFIAHLFRIFFYLLTGSDKKLTAARDIIYMLFVTAVNFLFILTVCSGKMMLYVFVGQAVGAAVYFRTAGKPVYRALRLITEKIRRLVLNISTFFITVMTKLNIFIKNVQKKLKKDEKIS